LIEQLTCSIQGTALYILMTPEDSELQVFSHGTTIRFMVANISNPLSLQETASFQIYITTSLQYDYYVSEEVSSLTI